MKKNSQTENELEKAQKQFDDFDSQVKSMTLDRMNTAPKEETEPQTKLSQKELDKSKDIYLKPNRTVSSQEKFNEKYREDWNYAKEYVNFIAEHKELIGETIETWTKGFPGVPAEFWLVPSGKPIWGPRYLAEQLSKCKYHRLVMKENITRGGDEAGQYYGSLAADTTIQRIDAVPVTKRRSIFMGATSF